MNPVDFAFAIGAGLISVASPCVLPVLPIIVTGSTEDSKHRPLLIVMGLSISFIIMGVISSAFFHLLTDNMVMLERFSGGIICIFGATMLLGFNPFKRLGFLSNIQTNENGYFSGFFLGLSLGVIWIPCVGPTLSSVFAKIASEQSMIYGISLLIVYAIGFSIPILLAGYSTQAFRQKVGIISQHPRIVASISGLLLIAFGGYTLIMTIPTAVEWLSNNKIL